MSSEQAQIVALVGYGNAYLRSPDATTVSRLRESSAFRYVAEVSFERVAEEGSEPAIARGVGEWLDDLRASGATRLWNVAFAWKHPDLPEHLAAAQSGGIPVAIQADHAEGFVLWYPRWVFAPSGARPWTVAYHGARSDVSQALPLSDLPAVNRHFQNALERAERLARRRELKATVWAERFKQAVRELNGLPTERAAPADLLPTVGYPVEARRLLAASIHADVFGGAGSWNELRIASQPLRAEYEAATANLYAALKFARVTASNSFTL